MTPELLAPPDGGASALGDLRGRIQADLFAALPAHFRRLGWTADRLRDWQRGRLRRLLAAAISRSAFHAGRLPGVDPARFELADLPSLPVMTKTEMMANFDELISGRALTLEAAERALAATRDEPRPAGQTTPSSPWPPTAASWNSSTPDTGRCRPEPPQPRSWSPTCITTCSR
jgi:hypothetical protein